MSDSLALRWATHSEIGLVRKNNQDSGYASAHLLAVADGMGGAAAGDLASAVAIQLVRRADRPEPVSGEEMLELLAGTLDQANDRLADLAADDHALEGMGTTFSGALFDGHQLGLVHIGDSRAYLLRNKELQRLTHDHSWVQSLVDEGKITAEEAAYHPHRSLLLKVLNGHDSANPDTALIELEAGDRLLFCSDGLCGLVEDGLIREILLRDEDREAAIEDLVAEAHAEGGIDNITIVVADVVPAAEVTDEREPDVIGAAATRDIPVVPTRGSSPEAPATTNATTSDVPRSPDSPGDEPEEQQRYAPQLAPRRHRWRAPIIMALIVALIAGGLFAGWSWSRTQFYVGSSQGNVAIHRGLAQEVLGIKLGQVVSVEQTRLDDLPPYLRQRVERTITADDEADARRVAGELRSAAEKCIRVRQERLAPPAPGPNPADPTQPTPTATPSASADPTEAC